MNAKAKKVPSFELELDASLIHAALISQATEKYPHVIITEDNSVMSLTKGRAINGRKPEIRASLTVYPLGMPDFSEDEAEEVAQAEEAPAEVVEEVATETTKTSAKKAPLFGKAQ